MSATIPARPFWAVPGTIRAFSRDQFTALSDLVDELGSPARIALPLRGDLVVVTRPADVERVLFSGPDVWAKGEEYDIPALALRQGLVTSRGERWRRDRTLLNPHFSKRHLEPLFPVMVSCARAAAARWEPGRVDMFGEMSRLTLDIAGRTLFGDALTEDEMRTTSDALGEALYELVAVGRSPLIWLVTQLPGVGMSRAGRAHWRTRRIRHAVDALDGVVGRLIDQRGGEAGAGDVLGELIAAGLPRDEIVDQAVTFLLAGHETTAVGLTWALHLLSAHGEVQERLAAEVDAVLAGRPPAAADLDRLPWARAVFSEALRLHPPVYLTMRRAARDDELGGRRVRAGTLALILANMLHRDPEVWPDPERFDPERFLPGAGRGRPRGAYIPFSGGRRSCIGSQFALMEGTAVLATLAQRFTLEPAPVWEVREEFTTTLRPAGGLPVELRARV